MCVLVRNPSAVHVAMPSTRSKTKKFKQSPPKPGTTVDGQWVSPERMESVRQAAQRTAEVAESSPMPTKVPLTLNASAVYYSQTWCPTGFKPSQTQLDERKAHLEWTRQIELEAEAEVKKTNKAYKKEQRAKQLGNAPEDAEGKALW